MSRMVGTISRGIRCPIIRQGDDLAQIVTDSVLEAAASEGFSLRDRDVIAITESVVARAQGNYCSVENIAADIKAKLDKSPKCKVRINTTKKQLLSIKLKKGWTLSMLTLNRGDNMKDIKNNTKLNFKKSRIIAFLEDKEGLGVTCYVDCVE